VSLPELFGTYLLHHQLARGTTSEVYLAQTTGDYPRLCAVKRVLPEVARLSGFGERFRQDATLLVRMIHGNLVQVLEVGAVEERLFIAMEHLDGVTLPELIGRVADHGPLSPELGLYVGLELCEALAYINQHRREVYGAVNFPSDAPWPLEVMLTFDGVVKIMDLGSYGAIRLGQQKISSLFQAPGYAVPEVIQRRSLNVRSDLFAIGLVIWELLEGRRLVADDPEGYIKQVLKGSWRAPMVRRKDVAGEVIRLVASMLQIDPEARPVGLEAARASLVAGLRRLSPAYGSAAVSQLLWKRCQPQIQRAEQLVHEALHSAPPSLYGETERDRAPAEVSTQSFGQAGKVDRHVDPPAKLKTGDVIPGTRYRLVRLVGRGGSAEVYAAQHIDLDRQVAIKILSSKLASNSAAIAQFRLEARACSRIGHPNIVEVIDFGELDDGRFFFAMELLDGVSLADLLDKEGLLPLPRALGIFRQITKALQASHKHGIVHRDIKPENVMLITRDGREDFVKLLDFGVMAFASDTRGLAVGTAGYMAPEQVGGALPGPAMDIYALGTALYETLCGQVPYLAESYDEFVRLQSSSPPPALRSHPGPAAQLPEGIERVVHRTLERDPAARHPSMADLEAELLKAQQDARVQTAWDDLPPPGEVRDRRRPPSGPVSRVERPRAGVWLVAAAVGLVAVIAAVVILALSSAPGRRGDPAATAAAAAAVAAAAAPVARQAASRPLSVEAARLLGSAEAAAGRGHFTHPAGACALDLLQRFEAGAPGRPEAAELRGRLARLLEGAGDNLGEAGLESSARTLYQEALLFDPSSGRLARLALAPAEAREGAGGGTDARRRPPAQLAEVAWLLSQVQLAVVEGRYLLPEGKSALHYLTALKRIDPGGQQTLVAQRTMTRTLRQKADKLHDVGRGAEARDVYRLILNLDPEDKLARARAEEPAAAAGAAVSAPPASSSSSALVAAGTRAAPAAPRPAKVDRDRAVALVAEGDQLLRQGKLSDAQGRFQAAVEANPGGVPALMGLATVAFERESYAKAVKLAQRAVRMDPTSRQGFMLLGDAYFNLLRYTEAVAAWERVLKLDPGNRRATQRLAHVRTKLNR